MTTSKRQYQVIEDNGGGIHLALLADSQQVVALLSGYEHNPDNLHADVEAWSASGTVTGWEGLGEAPQSLYDSLTESPAHGAIIAHGDTDGLEIYFDRIGAAGKRIYTSTTIGKLASKLITGQAHIELMDKARQMTTYSGIFTDDPAEATDDTYLVADMADIVKAHYGDLAAESVFGISLAESDDGAEAFCKRHEVELLD